MYVASVVPGGARAQRKGCREGKKWLGSIRLPCCRAQKLAFNVPTPQPQSQGRKSIYSIIHRFRYTPLSHIQRIYYFILSLFYLYFSLQLVCKRSRPCEKHSPDTGLKQGRGKGQERKKVYSFVSLSTECVVEFPKWCMNYYVSQFLIYFSSLSSPQGMRVSHIDSSLYIFIPQYIVP